MLPTTPLEALVPRNCTSLTAHAATRTDCGALFPPRLPALVLVALGQAELVPQGRQEPHELVLVLAGALLRSRGVHRALESRDGLGEELVSAQKPSSHRLPRAQAKLTDLHFPRKIGVERVLYESSMAILAMAVRQKANDDGRRADGAHDLEDDLPIHEPLFPCSNSDPGRDRSESEKWIDLGHQTSCCRARSG